MNTSRTETTGATTRYYGVTNHRGSRIKVTINGESKFIGYDYAASNAHTSAIVEAAGLLGYDDAKVVRFIADSESGRGCVYLLDYLAA